VHQDDRKGLILVISTICVALLILEKDEQDLAMYQTGKHF